MIRTADGYRFTTVPFGGQIQGLIVPTTDGTESERVIRFENICYLTEMAREIGYWAYPEAYTRAAPNWVRFYDVNNRTVYKSVLDELADIARLEFAARRIRPENYGGWGGCIPLDWTNPQLPIVTIDGSNAFRALIDTMVVPRCSVGNVPLVPETLSLRRAYYDFGQLRRFLLDSLQLGAGAHRWSEYAAAMADGSEYTRHHMTGPMVQNDGDTTITEGGQTTTIAGYLAPSVAQQWTARGRVQWTRSVSADLCAVINAYYYRPTLSSGLPYLSNTLNAWVECNGEYSLRNGEIKLYEAVFPTTLTFGSGISRGSPFYGLGQAIYNTNFGSQMPQFFALVNSWLTANVPEWSAQKEYLSLTAQAIIGDSGILSLPSEIASTGWNWRP